MLSFLMIEPGVVQDTIMANDKSKIGLMIEAKSNFPQDGKIIYTITPSAPKTFSLNFRVPGWANKYTASVGKKHYQGISGELLKIERKWRSGDVVSISFEMPIEILTGGFSYPGKIALKRGPQIFAVDKLLNSSVDSIKNLYCPANSIKLTDARQILPQEWSWKQAYSVPMMNSNKKTNVCLVPFSEAGQSGSELITWIKAQ